MAVLIEPPSSIIPSQLNSSSLTLPPLARENAKRTIHQNHIRSSSLVTLLEEGGKAAEQLALAIRSQTSGPDFEELVSRGTNILRSPFEKISSIPEEKLYQIVEYTPRRIELAHKMNGIARIVDHCKQNSQPWQTSESPQDLSNHLSLLAQEAKVAHRP